MKAHEARTIRNLIQSIRIQLDSIHHTLHAMDAAVVNDPPVSDFGKPNTAAAQLQAANAEANRALEQLEIPFSASARPTEDQ